MPGSNCNRIIDYGSEGNNGYLTFYEYDDSGSSNGMFSVLINP